MPDQPPAHPRQRGSGLGVTSLTTSLIGLVVFAWIPIVNLMLAVPLGLVGLVFGIVAIVKAPSRGGNGKGLGVAGLILGVLTIPASILFLILLGDQAAETVTQMTTG
ncbi:DUF4190 domain-containing protein [Glycomyces paridis]|uniref:DUF4190 domain-containing protein n=1 Tax=Glycomyces paridis TaxID=2126555 RepID=A0A4S8PHE2_9ACTN|nr:DUF4190 domain-containing protein [Glycomyces paridis]THV29035.1 DUF4190 domain-containing protein [Glycomyces paridis]